MSGMRKRRENRHNKVHRLIGRLAHRVFFPDGDKKGRRRQCGGSATWHDVLCQFHQ